MVIKSYPLCLVLAACLWISSCDGAAPMRPSEREAADLVKALAFTFQQGIIAALAGEGTIGGVSGELRVKGMQWRFDRYSPEGEVFIGGELIVDSAQRPMIMHGELDLSGALSGVLIIELSYNVSNGVFSGTITVDGVRVPLSERLCCLS
jgi:hypothetical protein